MDLLAGWYEVLFILVSNSSYVFWLFRGKFGPFPLLCSFLFRLICDYLPTYESLPRGRSINSVATAQQKISLVRAWLSVHESQ